MNKKNLFLKKAVRVNLFLISLKNPFATNYYHQISSSNAKSNLQYHCDSRYCILLRNMIHEKKNDLFRFRLVIFTNSSFIGYCLDHLHSFWLTEHFLSNQLFSSGFWMLHQIVACTVSYTNTFDPAVWGQYFSIPTILQPKTWTCVAAHWDQGRGD